MTPSAAPSSRQQRTRADLILLLVAIIWGTAFVGQRVAALNMGAFQFNGIRFLIGALVLLPLAWRNRHRTASLSRMDIRDIAIAGLLLFSGASFQQIGLRYTTASNAGFITGLYVVFIPLVVALGWKHKLRRVVWVASASAGVGLFLLSTGGSFRLAPGDALELVCAVMWCFHVIWLGLLVQRLDPLRIAIGQNILCGVLSLFTAGLIEGTTFSHSLVNWAAILYTGVFSIGVGYTLQAVGQRQAPAADAAIILSLEAVFAALFGWMILGESLTPIQLTGCGLMLAGMLLAHLPEKPG